MATNPELTPIIPAKKIFPIAYGNEEETGMLDDVSGDFQEPYKLVSALRSYVPPELLTTQPGNTLFLKNGSKIYPGTSVGTSVATNLERATAECASVDELTMAVRASEKILVKTAEAYAARQSSNKGQAVNVRIQRRVVDSMGSRKGCHDNYGITRKFSYAMSDNVPPLVLAHLVSRSFITGAGHVHENGLSFAQKVGGLDHVDSYGYFGSMCRVSLDEGTPRFEVRCNDINISDWAVRVRIGGAAIALALAQTPLAVALSNTTELTAIRKANAMNRLRLNPDGSISASPYTQRALDIQKRIAELTLMDLIRHVDEVPDELLGVAHDIYAFCEDFQKICDGKETVSLVADRADWAAKFNLTVQGMEKDKALGITRRVNDFRSQATDLLYDYIGVRADSGKLQHTIYGRGYQLRDKGVFRNSPKSSRQADQLYMNPPRATRAAVRGYLMRNYDVTYCNWDLITVADHEGRTVSVKLPDVTQNALTEDDVDNLAALESR